MYSSESDNFTYPEDQWERKLLVFRIFYSFWTSGQLLSSSTTNQMLGTLDFKGSYKHWAPYICFLRAQPCIMMHTCNLCKPQPLSTNWTSLPSKESNPGWTITQTIKITLNGQTSWPSQILCCLINYKYYIILKTRKILWDIKVPTHCSQGVWDHYQQVVMGACGHSSTVCGYSTMWLSSLAGLVLRALLRINPQYNMLFHHWLSQGLMLGYTREVIFRLRQKTGKTVGQRPRTYVWLFTGC